MSAQDDSSTRSWQSLADEWVAHADTNDYRNHFLMPKMLAMVGDVAGHPCFQARVSRWIKNEGGQPMFFAVDHDFDRVAWEEHMTAAFTKPVLRRHRPLEDYMAAPLSAGLQLREFREPVPTDEELARSHRFWRLKRIPYFLFTRWTKY